MGKQRTLNIIVVVFCGILGAWAGYWLGHLAGWSEEADWPATVGGGEGAILLSIGMSVLFVLISASLIFWLPERRVRRVLRTGEHAEATVVRVKETGAVSRNTRGTKHQVACELEVCPEGASPYRARVTQFVTDAEESALRPGTRVSVRVDPFKRTRVAIEGPIAPAVG